MIFGAGLCFFSNSSRKCEMWCRPLFFQTCIQNLILLCIALACCLFFFFYTIYYYFWNFGNDINYRIYYRISTIEFTIEFQKLALNACYFENSIQISTIEFSIELRGVTIEFLSLTYRVLGMHIWLRIGSFRAILCRSDAQLALFL